MYAHMGTNRHRTKAWRRKHFKRTLQVYSPAFLGEDKSGILEAGDKIVLHSSLLPDLEDFMEDGPLIFSVMDKGAGTQTHCGVWEFSGERSDTVYMPRWMMKNLGVTDGASLSFQLPHQVPRASFLKVRPTSTAFAEAASDPKSELEHALRRFTVATIGDVIPVEVAGSLHGLEVLEVKPDHASKAVCLIQTECEIDFVEAEGGAATETVKLGEPRAGVVAPGQSHFYSIVLPAGSSLAITVEATPADGAVPAAGAGGMSTPVLDERSRADADVYVSTEAPKPTRHKHTWGDASVSARKRVVVPAVEAPTAVYIAVNGYGGRSAAYSFGTEVVEAGSEPEAVMTSGHGGGEAKAEEGMGTCGTCGKHIPTRTLPMHEAFCARNNWRCPQCSEVIRIADKGAHAHCEECGAAIHPDGMAKHRHLVHAPIECACGWVVAPDMMATHLEFECDMRPVPCPFCSVSFPLRKLAAHKEYCGGRSMPCEVCGESVVLSRMSIHLAVAHGMNPSVGELDGSSAVDAAFDMLKSTEVTEGETADAAMARMVAASELAQPSRGSGAPTTRREEVRQRIMGDVVPPVVPTSVVPAPAPPAFQCPICKQGFARMDDLQVHQLTAGCSPPGAAAVEADPKACPVCHKVFPSIDDMQVHRLTECVEAGGGSEPAPSPPPPDTAALTCPRCYASLPSYTALEAHMEECSPAPAPATSSDSNAYDSDGAQSYVYSDMDEEYNSDFDEPALSPLPPASASPDPVAVSDVEAVVAPAVLPAFRAPGNGVDVVGDGDVAILAGASRPDLTGAVSGVGWRTFTCVCGYVADEEDMLEVHKLHSCPRRETFSTDM